ncbi:MAG: hypothetical protein AAF806_06500 [Bacteroidota bacterium]
MKRTSTYQYLQSYTSKENILKELIQYTAEPFYNGYTTIHLQNSKEESQITTWNRYVAESKEKGVYETLKKYLVQFQFPVNENISQTKAYKDVTLRGKTSSGIESATGLVLKDADKLQLYIYSSLAGKIPVIVANNQFDFQSIIQALTRRNEPQFIPASMGAAIIRGLNNWDRLRAAQRAFRSSMSSKELIESKHLYQDNLIVLSRNPYSNVSAEQMRLEDEEWLNQSLEIRLEHECTHYFTLRHFNKMANNMYDELLADYMGITKVLPQYRSDWFLKFVGLEQYPIFRESGRLKNYLGKSPLSDSAFQILKKIVKQASDNLELFDQQFPTSNTLIDRKQKLLTLCSLNLVEIASREGLSLLSEAYERQVNASIMSH